MLTIDRVSDHDLSTNFTCLGTNSYDKTNKTVTLVRRGQCWLTVLSGMSGSFEPSFTLVSLSLCTPDSYSSAVIVFACACFTATVVLVRYFAIDLALLFRPWLSWISHRKGKKNQN